MWTLAQAAEYLGYSTSGLRKLVKRGDVRAFQARKHSPLKFRKEWLDEFIESHSTTPGELPELAPAKRKKKAPPLTSEAFHNESDFDWSLSDLAGGPEQLVNAG